MGGAKRYPSCFVKAVIGFREKPILTSSSAPKFRHLNSRQSVTLGAAEAVKDAMNA